MTDTHSKKVRSYNMSRIRSANTKPEMTVRKFLFSKGYRYRLHVRDLPGKPDIVLPKFRTVIFVHGCFWHCHKGCRYFVMPKSKKSYWGPKLSGNVAKDTINRKALRKLGWRSIIVWECNLKKDKAIKELNKLIKQLESTQL